MEMEEGRGLVVGAKQWGGAGLDGGWLYFASSRTSSRLASPVAQGTGEENDGDGRERWDYNARFMNFGIRYDLVLAWKGRKGISKWAEGTGMVSNVESDGLFDSRKNGRWSFFINH
jgi:hypothetical protein